MRAIMALVIGMGVLIVAGVATIGVTIARRLSTSSVAAAVTINEPPGTRIIAMSPAADRLALLLQGGGPDRIVLLDPRSGAVAGRIGLAP